MFYLGMAAVVTKLGLLSVWFILLFCLTQGLHISMLLDQATEKSGSGRYGYGLDENYQIAGAYVEQPNPAQDNADPLLQSLIAQQRTNFFEQQRILQEIQRK